MNLEEWVRTQGGVAHRGAAIAAGFPRRTIGPGIRAIRRHWLAVPDAPADLVAAAEGSARLACVSVARRRGWWMPEGVAPGIHLALDPHAAAVRGTAVTHWSRPLAPAPAWGLMESIEDALSHVAACVDAVSARIIWESAIRTEKLSVDALRAVRWTTTASRDLAAQVTGLSDSGLETMFVVRLSGWGLPLVQQAMVAGHRVDLLIGDRLVVQVDGYAHHSSSAQRSRDVALDAELRLRGYTVLRFTYSQVVHDWPSVERTIARAIAAGAHLIAS